MSQNHINLTFTPERAAKDLLEVLDALESGVMPPELMMGASAAISMWEAFTGLGGTPAPRSSEELHERIALARSQATALVAGAYDFQVVRTS